MTVIQFPTKAKTNGHAQESSAILVDPVPRAPVKTKPSNNEVRTVGDLYDSDKDISDIAKEMRKWLRKNIEGVKFSVRISRFSMGQSVHVTLTDLPNRVPLYCRDYELALLDNKHSDWEGSWRSSAVQTMLEAARNQLDRHNNSLTDSHTDLCNVKFFAHVNICSKLNATRSDLIKKAGEADRAELEQTQIIDTAHDVLTLSHVQHAAIMLGLRVREHVENTQWSIYQPVTDIELIRGDIEILAAFISGMQFQIDRR